MKIINCNCSAMGNNEQNSVLKNQIGSQNNDSQ